MDEHGSERPSGVGIGTVIVVSGLLSGFVSCLVVSFAFALYLTATDGGTLGGGYENGGLEDGAFEEEASEWQAPIDADPFATIESAFPADDRSPHVYRFDLPADTIYVRADLDVGDVDLDLRVTFGEEAAKNEDWRVEADGASGDEYAWIARYDDAEFGRRPFMVRVDCYADADEDAPYTLELTLIRSETIGRLAPGERARGTVSLESGHRAAYEVVVPAGVEAVCVDLVDVRQDLGLAADVMPVVDAAHAAATAMTPLARESLVLDRGELRLGPGEQTLHVVVIDRNWIDRLIPFEIRVSEGSRTPDEIRRLPALPRPRNDAELAARSVVAIITEDGEGSGVVVGRDRRILTAAHVVEGAELGSPDVVICVTTDVEREPLELLRGKVIRRDDDRDIAIVEVTSTIHGDPVPDDWKLPAIALRDDQPTLLAEIVHACGYPVLHSSEERAEITWTTGAVSGFENPHGFDLVRFDAEISSGSSGGALLDDEHRLIGVTIAMHGDLSEFSATGLAIPVDEFPADWMELIR